MAHFHDDLGQSVFGVLRAKWYIRAYAKATSYSEYSNACIKESPGSRDSQWIPNIDAWKVRTSNFKTYTYTAFNKADLNSFFV